VRLNEEIHHNGSDDGQNKVYQGFQNEDYDYADYKQNNENYNLNETEGRQ
jgi:hypothetical protein